MLYVDYRLGFDTVMHMPVANLWQVTLLRDHGWRAFACARRASSVCPWILGGGSMALGCGVVIRGLFHEHRDVVVPMRMLRHQIRRL